MKDKTVSQFKTSDFYLSAFLRTQGLELIKIDKTNPRRALFIFKDRKDRRSLVEDFLFGRTKVEPKSFISAIKEFKRLLYSDYAK